MSIAITDEHRALAETVSRFLDNRNALAAARELLDADEETQSTMWDEMVSLGWLGLHLPEEYGGSGFGFEELVIVVEETGRTLTPGSLVPTVIASAVINAGVNDALKRQLLPGLADGSTAAGVGLEGEVTVVDGKASGSAGTVLGGGLAKVLVVPAGDDVVIVAVGEGVSVQTPLNLDPTRRSSRVTLNNAPTTVIPGAAQALTDIARLILSAEAVGLSAACTDSAAAYAKEREQFGRVIGTFQAVKHHCANMAVATELATSAVWDSAKAASTGGDTFTFTAAVAATLAASAAHLCANLNTQVHGGIAITWEHDAHLYMRRAMILGTYLRADKAAEDLVELTRRGTTRGKEIELPVEAEPIREEVRAFADSIKGLPFEEQRSKLIETGYVMPHWPKPWGREAGAIEQLVIEQEFSVAGIKRPRYGITAWNILTVIQHGTPEQTDRWVPPALNQDDIWCQLFSEPDAGSDAAAVKTKATRVDGGWLVNGQKVWTSGAHDSAFGFATVRTDSDAPKHKGITMMVIDMKADGVEVRPLRQTTGASDFNEVFFDDVFVPDDDVVGPINSGWTVARATLSNESVSIGGGEVDVSYPPTRLVPLFDAHPDRIGGSAARIGHYIATHHALGLLNLRAASRSVEGAGPGPEGAMAKLVLSELGHDAAALLAQLGGPDTPFIEDLDYISQMVLLMHRGTSIAGGTSEIKRNQIGERILGLPRDPLIK